MSIAQHLDTLCDPKQTLKHTDLIELSDIMPGDLAHLGSSWNHMPLDRRQKLVSQLSEMAENDVCLDFRAIFKLGLHDPDSQVREQCISSLWECDDKDLISIFISMLNNDPSDLVRAAVAQGLGNFAILAEDNKLLPKNYSEIRQALLGIVHNPKEDLDVRRRAIEASSPFSDPEVRKAILDAYQSSVPELRRSAVFAMGVNAHPEWIPTIIAETTNPDPAMRYEAASACGNLGEESSVSHIFPLLQDEDIEVRLAAVHSLGAIGGTIAKKALTSCIRSSDEVLRDAANAALEHANYDEASMPFHFRA